MTQEEREFDLICMGRAGVDLCADQIGTGIEGATTFSKSLGGRPANVAVGACRLGLQTAILTRIGDEDLGGFIKKTLRKEGVDDSMLVTDPNGLTALTLLGGHTPERFSQMYYRENCADAAFCEEDFSLETLFRGKALLVTGALCSTKQMFENACKAITLALEAKTKVVLDIDFCSVLWGLTQYDGGGSFSDEDTCIQERLQDLLPMCDLLVGTEEEFKIAANCQDLKEAIETLQNLTHAILVLKKGFRGCSVFTSYTDEEISSEGFHVPLQNTLGMEEAFLSAFLRGWLTGQPLSTCCKWGNVCSALVSSRHGFLPEMPFWQELQEFLEKDEDFCVSGLNSLHESLSKSSKSMEDLCVLSIDHRSYFKRFSATPEKIKEFKDLIYQALLQVQKKEAGAELGMILDEDYSSSILQEVDADHIWCSTCIEKADTFPLSFLEGREASEILRRRPKNLVTKVLVRHPLASKDREIEQQVRRLKDLHRASMEWGQEWMLELVIEPDTIACNQVYPQIMDEYYEAGVYPNWWKLPPIRREETWEKISEVLTKNDKNCRGVLIFGGNEELLPLSATLRCIRSQKFIKGFVVGRTIWAQAAKKWFRGQMSDREVIEEVASRYMLLIDSWHENLVLEEV